MVYHFSFRINLISLFLICSLFAIAFAAQGAFPARYPQQPRHDSENIPVKRIIVLAPDITELVFAAGAGEKLVGVARFSDYPAAAKTLPIVGDVSGIDLERVLSLNPDLIIAWKSGNKASDIAKLSSLGLRVFSIEPKRLSDIPKLIRALGLLMGTTLYAERSASEFERGLFGLSQKTPQRVSAFYQIWNAPLITVNSEHLISDVVLRCGGVNIFSGAALLTPIVSLENVVMANPDVILISNSNLQSGLESWGRFPLMRAVANERIVEIPPDLIQRNTPRILEGAKMICGVLAQAGS